MSQVEIRIPEVGQTTSEVTLVKWKKQIGDPVKRGDVLADLETDKMIVELESFAQGTLAQRLAEEGQTVAVGAVVAVLEAEKKVAGKSASPVFQGAKAPAPSSSPMAPAAFAISVEAPFASKLGNGHASLETSPPATPTKAKASPAAKMLAGQLAVDLTTITGTGPEGLIIRRNVEEASGAALKTAATPPPAGTTSTIDAGGEPIDRHRLATGRAMSQSKREIPHFYLEIEVNTDKMEVDRAWRNQESGEVKITVTDYLIAACARALQVMPRLNAAFENDRIHYYPEVHMGVAVNAPQGLVLPAIRSAETLSLSEIAKARLALIERTREGRMDPVQPTFTISNLGMHGITRFTAIIPPRQAAILAIGMIQKRLVLEHGEIRNQRFMTLTLAIDHRVADGAEGAQFLAKVRELLENDVAQF